MEQFQIDAARGNAFAKWREMGSPQRPTEEQYGCLEAASRLPQAAPPRRREVAESGEIALEFELPRHGVTLFRLRGAG